MHTRKLAFIDLETSGLNSTIHEILEIGMVLAEQIISTDRKVNLKIVDELDLRVAPKHIEKADPESLKIIHYSPEKWLFAADLKDALGALSKKTTDAMMVGHNVAHDHAFLERAFTETGIVNSMHYHKLDTISIAYAKLCGREDIEKLSLHFLSQYLGIENKQPHSAISDARTTFLIFEKLMAL